MECVVISFRSALVDESSPLFFCSHTQLLISSLLNILFKILFYTQSFVNVRAKLLRLIGARLQNIHYGKRHFYNIAIGLLYTIKKIRNNFICHVFSFCSELRAGLG